MKNDILELLYNLNQEFCSTCNTFNKHAFFKSRKDYTFYGIGYCSKLKKMKKWTSRCDEFMRKVNTSGCRKKSRRKEIL